MDYIQARIVSQSVKMLGGRVTKTAVRNALRGDGTVPIVMAPIPGPFQRRSGYFTTDDVPGCGIEVRYNEDRDVMVIEVHPSGSVVVR